MRYQPAYVYPGTQPVARKAMEQKPSWRFEKPRLLDNYEHGSVKLLRFLLIVFGVLLFIVGGAHYFTAQLAQSWEKVTVKITRADVVRLKYADSKPLFTAKLEYTYDIAGKTYTGTRLAVRPMRSQSPGEVKRHLAPYTPGRSVLAHVNPSKPAQAYLTTNPGLYLYSLIIPGLVMMAISLAIGQALYIHAVRQRRKAWRFGEFTKGPVAGTA